MVDDGRRAWEPDRLLFSPKLELRKLKVLRLVDSDASFTLWELRVMSYRSRVFAKVVLHLLMSGQLSRFRL